MRRASVAQSGPSTTWGDGGMDTTRSVPLPRPLHELTLSRLDIPALAVALHHGADLREEVAARLALDEARRHHEEDPYSAVWSTIVPNRLVAYRSRFEVDLNRPPERAIYLRPEDAWGLSVWRERPPPELLERSLAQYSSFYTTLEEALDLLLARHPRVLVLDLHTYNHRRTGPRAAPADPHANPALNVGTGTMERGRWAPVVDAFLDGARRAGLDEPIDVRENVRFLGGQLPAWVHGRYPSQACALALEVKKTFMDEWTGRVDIRRLHGWREVLRAGTSAALAALEGV